uniref:LPXTG-domain-containing protein n=1 Tax=Bionectria ochroleuca TaxID=29856 RepID=A0A8H7TSI6_BIOOC
MARLSSALLLVLSTLTVLSLALEFTPGSSCASLCLDNGETDAFDAAASSTNSSDITCLDASFGTDAKGKKYKSCLECLAKSDKVEGSESDIHWYLYNVRYATSTCLFGLPSPASTQMNSPCILDNACKNLKGPLTEDNLNASRTDTYGYCDAASGAFKEKAVWPCVKCLQATSDQKYLSNFMIALLAGCQQKTEPGKTLSLSGTIFQSTRINITEPTENILDRPEGAGSNSLTTGAIVGIAIGAALFVLGGIALFFMHRRRKRQIEKNEKADYHASQANSPDPILPPTEASCPPPSAPTASRATADSTTWKSWTRKGVRADPPSTPPGHPRAACRTTCRRLLPRNRRAPQSSGVHPSTMRPRHLRPQLEGTIHPPRQSPSRSRHTALTPGR